jgi:hypothetical protein
LLLKTKWLPLESLHCVFPLVYGIVHMQMLWSVHIIIPWWGQHVNIFRLKLNVVPCLQESNLSLSKFHILNRYNFVECMQLSSGIDRGQQITVSHTQNLNLSFDSTLSTLSIITVGSWIFFCCLLFSWDKASWYLAEVEMLYLPQIKMVELIITR